MANSSSSTAVNLPASDVWSLDGRTRIKICGITNVADALHSAAAGVDFLGFNFYRRSPRYLDPETAREIIAQLPPGVLSVGVFVNEPEPQSVLEIAHDAGVGAVQLHGEELPDYCAAINTLPVIKAFRVKPGFDAGAIREFSSVRAILLDAYSREEHGGTGHTFNWDVARASSFASQPLFLAGGLGVDNVAEAVRRVQPFAVDACSRLESRPGVKDQVLVAEFINAVREVSKPKYP